MSQRFSARVEEHLGLRTADLPRGLPWVYLAGAFLAVPVMSRNVFQLSPREQLESLVGNAIPFACVPASVHAVYRFILPRLLDRARSPGARALIHVLASGIAASLPAAVLHSVISLFGWSRAPLSGFVATSVVLTWSILFPSKLVLAWRGRAEKSEALRQKAHAASLRNELYAIQSRAHPHFLFNAINTVAALIPEDPRRAEETLERFADVLRYILETATATATPLSADIAILREYLEIQRARFGDHLDYSIEVHAALDGVQAPPLLALPLVENAVVHGVAASGSGRIVVRVGTRQGRLELDVKDDGPGLGGSSRRGSGTALRDLERRLEILYAGEASLVMRGRGAGGCAATIRVPLEGGVAP